MTRFIRRHGSAAVPQRSSSQCLVTTQRLISSAGQVAEAY